LIKPPFTITSDSKAFKNSLSVFFMISVFWIERELRSITKSVSFPESSI